MKKQSLILLVVVGMTIGGLFLYRSLTLAERQSHIFCELLSPRMNKDEVLRTLRQFGSIDYNLSTFGNGNFEIYIEYVDPQIVGRKTYILSFSDEEYLGASVMASFWEGIDRVNAVCEP